MSEVRMMEAFLRHPVQ